MLKPSEQEELWQTMRQVTEMLGDNVMLLVEKGLTQTLAVDMILREWTVMLALPPRSEPIKTDETIS